ncbi:TPA: SMC-Scp complex subunit ScpB [Candidatus Micrarchaeota archaeon]|nr:SMC-Scp complex subunit ScpB [Candidatus Micrarchaeota archaeon]
MPADINEKRVIEAALFISPRELTLQEMKQLTGIGALGYIQKMAEELVQEYKDKGSAIEIVNMDGKYSMRIKNDYVNRVKQFAQETEISKPALRTLAYISKHDGMLKSELARKIGAQIYDDVRELVEKGFIKTHKAGRTAKITLTEKFRTYFGDVKANVVAQQAQQTIPTATAANSEENTKESKSESTESKSAEDESQQMTL